MSAADPMHRGPGRPRSADPMKSISVGFPLSRLAALDGLVRQRQQTDPAITRQDLVREGVDTLLFAQKRSKKK